ncbi:MAG: OsmC family protein [Thermomicrobiales bacterium]
MSTLREFLYQKRDALRARREAAAADPDSQHPRIFEARVTAEGRSGVRRIRIRDHQILSDSGPELAGYDFGPGSPEIQAGVLGSCLTHIFEIQAAEREIWLDALEVQVRAVQDFRAGQPGFEDVPRWPHQFNYTVTIESGEPEERIRELHQAVEDVCPILNLLVNPQTITGSVKLNGKQDVSTLTKGPAVTAVAG